jgi:hypothetical protein
MNKLHSCYIISLLTLLNKRISFHEIRNAGMQSEVGGGMTFGNSISSSQSILNNMVGHLHRALYNGNPLL